MYATLSNGQEISLVNKNNSIFVYEKDSDVVIAIINNKTLPDSITPEFIKKIETEIAWQHNY